MPCPGRARHQAVPRDADAPSRFQYGYGEILPVSTQAHWLYACPVPDRNVARSVATHLALSLCYHLAYRLVVQQHPTGVDQPNTFHPGPSRPIEMHSVLDLGNGVAALSPNDRGGRAVLVRAAGGASWVVELRDEV